MRNPELVEVPCNHSEDTASQSSCPTCFGRGFRYVPRGWSAAEFDRAFAQLRMFARD